MKTIKDRIDEMKQKGRHIGDYEILKAFEQAQHQEYKRMSRLYERAKNIAREPDAYFITLTYDDRHLEQANKENMRKWAKKHLNRFIGNDDYGKENGRYHHHLFGNLKKHITDLASSWEFGAINIEKFRGGKSDIKKIVKYIDRVAKHAIKHTASEIIRSKLK